MPADSVPAKWSSADLLKAVEQLPPREVDDLYWRLQKMRSRRRGASLPRAEAALLAKINRGFPEIWWDHYHRLLKKRRRQILTKDEHRELLRLTDQVEQQEAKRLQALVRLAKHRKQPLRDLMRDLGLPAKIHA